MIVQMHVSRQLLEEIFRLGERKIVEIYMRDDDVIEIEVQAPDAPEGTTHMNPTYSGSYPGSMEDVEMTDPGWLQQ